MQVRQRGTPLAPSPARWPKNDRGVAAVEFAIIMPVLMMALFGIMAFGFAMASRLPSPAVPARGRDSAPSTAAS